MTITSSPKLSALAVLAIVLAACGSGDATGDATTDADPSQSAAEASVDQADTHSSAPDSQPDASNIDWATVDLSTIDWASIDFREVDWAAIEGNPTVSNIDQATRDLIASRMNPGSATLTIGDQTYQFDSFLCAFGHEATQSDTYSLSTSTFGEIDGTRVQLSADIEDPLTQGRYEGEGVIHRIHVDDVSDFEDPSVSFQMRSADAIQVDGYHITAEGTFDDGLTEGQTAEIPGSLDATCSDQSRR